MFLPCNLSRLGQYQNLIVRCPWSSLRWLYAKVTAERRHGLRVLRSSNFLILYLLSLRELPKRKASTRNVFAYAELDSYLGKN